MPRSAANWLGMSSAEETAMARTICTTCRSVCTAGGNSQMLPRTSASTHEHADGVLVVGSRHGRPSRGRLVSLTSKIFSWIVFKYIQSRTVWHKCSKSRTFWYKCKSNMPPWRKCAKSRAVLAYTRKSHAVLVHAFCMDCVRL